MLKANIDQQAFFLLSVLREIADPYHEARVTIERLAEKIDKSKETTRRALEALVAHELVVITREGRRNVYRIKPITTSQP
ncbi:hypothetical protein [Caballeronia sp. DA-9]|uniref:hypothetical protein n=1 Tax=Caballeronia sp. DA-9 TaxID=3436237 RepID=UPI003F674751